MAVIEVETFTLASGVSVEKFHSLDEQMQEWCYLNRPGIARRTVAVDANGKFIVVTLFGEASQADAGYRNYAGISQEWLACIAEGSTTHEVFSLF
jgi:hypothetical protein